MMRGVTEVHGQDHDSKSTQSQGKSGGRAEAGGTGGLALGPPGTSNSSHSSQDQSSPSTGPALRLAGTVRRRQKRTVPTWFPTGRDSSSSVPPSENTGGLHGGYKPVRGLACGGRGVNRQTGLSQP